jgi:hypothetical protein
VDARNVRLDGTLVGNVTQNAVGRVDQRIGIGAVQGTVDARDITATGRVAAFITQTGAGNNLNDKQLILIGSVATTPTAAI